MSHPRERGRGRDGGRDGREKTCDWARGRRGTRGSVEKRRAGRFGASTRAHLEGDAGVGGDGEDRDEGGCGMDDGGGSPVSVAIVAGRRGYRRRFAGVTPPARQRLYRVQVQTRVHKSENVETRHTRGLRETENGGPLGPLGPEERGGLGVGGRHASPRAAREGKCAAPNPAPANAPPGRLRPKKTRPGEAP